MMMRAQYDTKIQLCEDEILGNAVGLFLAGHDVPANGLIFLVSLLATHPEAAARLMEEIDREIGDGQVSYEQIFRLPELNKVFQEMLRVLSPALLIFRQALVDSSLGDVEIKAGTEVLLSPFMTNTDPARLRKPAPLPARALGQDQTFGLRVPAFRHRPQTLPGRRLRRDPAQAGDHQDLPALPPHPGRRRPDGFQIHHRGAAQGPGASSS